jgi:hypothetical protein
MTYLKEKLSLLELNFICLNSSIRINQDKDNALTDIEELRYLLGSVETELSKGDTIF